MPGFVRKTWPLFAALGLLWAALWVLFERATGLTGGHLTYALDDAYIHMAIAKNFAEHGVWGVTRYAFSSSSSSLLWTLLLALVYALFGVNESAPFVLNVICASAAVFLVFFALHRLRLHPFVNFCVLAAVVFLTPLPSLVFCGMEHSMHILTTVAFVYLAAGLMSMEGRGGKGGLRDGALLLLLAALVVMSRFEGMFLVFFACVLFFVRGRFLYSVILGLCGVLPVAVYGLISTSRGWFFLPNSVLLKGNRAALSSPGGFADFLVAAGRQLLQTPHLYFLILGAAVFFIVLYQRRERIWERPQLMILLFVSSAAAHLMFAKTGWFYRYEAYLVAAGFFTVGAALSELLPQGSRLSARAWPSLLAVLFILLLISPHFVRRGVESFAGTPRATKNIYEQQYQMGLFLKRFYPGGSVAANDIGAINYLNDMRNLDLWGLGSLEPAKLHLEGKLSPERLDALARENGVQIAVVYEHVLERWGGRPERWVRVGQWAIPDNLVCGAYVVSWYAVDPAEADRLKENLKAFSPQLPPGVVQSGEYLDKR